MSVMQKTTPSSANNLYSDLEDYILVMDRNEDNSEELDIYAQLAQKEKDLILAAELGKALLERNEELSRANEKITEDYTSKLELLEQEKHALSRKLDSIEGDFDSRLAELQSDVDQLQKELVDSQSLLRVTEKEKSRLVQDLTEQNHRLTQQLKLSSKTEEHLTNQLQSLREQFNARRSNFSDHSLQLEGLKEEIELLSDRKLDLERRIQFLIDERENLSLSLEESSDRIHMLEKHAKEQDQQLRGHKRDMDELREVNTGLQDKLESIRRSCSTPSYGHTSLYNEIEMSSQSSIDEDIRSLTGSQSGRSRPHSHPGSSIGFHGDFADEIECDDAELPDGEDNWKFRQELVEIYQQLFRLCVDLRRRRENLSADSGLPPSPEEIHAQQIRVGMMSSIIKELRSLMQDISSSDAACGVCQSLSEDRNEVSKLRQQIEERNKELKQKQDEVSELTTKLTIQEREKTAMQEQRDQVKTDLSNSKLAKEEIVKKAWEGRDQAVARKNAVEIELAKTRIDIMHVNSQLMEAIQQKIELSQQLEQWQVDMQVLLDEQLKKKLKTQEIEDRKRAKSQRQPSASAKSKLFRLWPR